MNAKEQAIEIYNQHIDLASTDGKLFRKTVMDQLMSQTGCSVSSAATNYNYAKKQAKPIEGLGRSPVPKGVKKMGGKTHKKDENLLPDDECFSVIELVDNDGVAEVGRCQSFLFQGDASEKFDDKIAAWPNSSWIMIQGLGPNSGDTFKLSPGEKLIKEYSVA